MIMRGHVKFVAALLIAAPLPVAAAVIADQNTLVPTGLGDFVLSTSVRATPGSSFSTAIVQTLTAGQSGLLAGVEAQVYGSVGTFRFSLYDGDLAGGTGAFIGSIDRVVAAFPNVAGQAVSSFDVSGFGFHVSAGHVFSLLASAGSPRASFGQAIGYSPPGQFDADGNPVMVFNAPYVGGAASATGDGGLTWTPRGVDRGYRTFVDVATSAAAPLMPVSGGPSNAFQFTFTAKPGERVFVDPPVTSGYDFTLGAGGPSIASALFPLIAGDTNGYQLFALDGTPLGTATAGTAFTFAPGGVRGFRLRGIDAALPAGDTTAFATGFTFTGAGAVSLTQTPNPVTQVPEPASWAMMVVGFGLVGLVRRRSLVRA
jgi:hypothetical protein